MEFYQLFEKRNGSESLELKGTYLRREDAEAAAEKIPTSSGYRLHLYKLGNDTPQVTGSGGELVMDMAEIELNHGDNLQEYMPLSDWEDEVRNSLSLPEAQR